MTACAGPTRQRILQIHPTSRCNLQCPHCYSGSGPWARDSLDPATIEDLLSDAASMGFERLSVSGGEPLLYTGLPRVLLRAKSLGMRTSLATNGYFLDERHLGPIRDHLDGLAISLDGLPETHNFMRGSSAAFTRLCSGLKYIRDTRIPFGFIHTVTQKSWSDLAWLAEFAVDNGGDLLQLHPLELAGRAENRLESIALTEDLTYRVYLLAAALAAKYCGRLSIQTDLLHRDQVLGDPALIYADTPAINQDDDTSPFLGVLVLEADGSIVPLSFGFSQRYQICNIKEQRLAAAWPAFVNKTNQSFRRLCRDVFKLLTEGEQVLFNWHEHIAAQSHLGDRQLSSVSPQ